MIQQQNSVAQDQAQQTYQMVVSEFATSLSQANSALTSADSAATATLSQAKAADQGALGKANAQINAIVNQITTQAAAQQASDDLSLTQTQQVISSAQQKLNVIINTASQSKATIQAAAAKDLATQQAKMAAGKAQHERDWKIALLKIFSTVDSEKANAAQGTYFGYTASQWWDITQGAAEGALQGALNAVNGVQDGIIGMANFGLTITGIGPIAGLFGWNLNIPSPDWSRGLIVTEGDTAHNVSKFLGGQGILTLITLGGSAEEELAGEGTKLCPTDCFVAGTEVITGENANGTFSETPIQDIAVGDYVLTRDQSDPDGPLQEEEVTAVEQHTVYTLQNVTVKGADGTTEVIQSTPNHPFYVGGEGWTYAGDLVAGDELEMPDGSFATAVSSTSVADPTGVTVYNFTVNNDHTYFVDQGGAVVWVHNTCPNPFGKTGDLITQATRECGRSTIG